MSTPANNQPAPDFETLYDVEGQVEPRLLAALQSAGIFQPEASRGAGETACPRVEVRMELGACVNRTYLPTGATQRREALPTGYAFSLVFSVVTDRQHSPLAHGKYRAKVRLLAGQYFTRLNAALPYHVIEKMEESGTTPGMYHQDAENEDISQVRFAGVISIRSGSWPVPAPQS